MKLTPDRRREIAEKCGISPDYLYQVLTDRKRASPGLCVALERESNGEISRKSLCKDWKSIWPELAANAAQPANALQA